MGGPDTSVGRVAGEGRPMRADARRNRERVLEAARDAFADHGPDASLEDIAKSAGVGIGTLYRHFPNRQALQQAVFDETASVLCQYGEQLGESDDPYAALRSWLHAQIEHTARYRSLGAAVMLDALDSDAVERMVAAADEEPAANDGATCQQLRSMGERLLERAQMAGVVRPDVDVDDVCRMGSAIALATEEAPGPVCVERLFAVMMDGLKAESATAHA